MSAQHNHPVEISTKMPYETRFVAVNGSQMAYVEAGQGDPILFLHGNPTSKYIWRNIMPWLEDKGRVIAPDLIGMGESDKPALAYRYQDHYKYIEGFINELGLDNVTLVLHDWGSALGFNFAAQNPDRIKAIAFMESIVRPGSWSDFPFPFRIGNWLMRAPGIGWLMIRAGNILIKQVLPRAIVRGLSEEEKAVYGAPYPTIDSRKPLHQWPSEIPIDGKPADTYEIVDSYSKWLQQTDIPKLFFYGSPGVLIVPEVAVWVKEQFLNLTSFDIGKGIHFIQEDNPHFIGEKLAEWYVQL